MKTKISSLILLAMSIGLGSASATVTIAFESGNINTSTGSKVAVGTVGVVVVDTGGDGFSFNSAGTYASIVGSTLAAGNAIGADKILRVFQAADVDVDGSAPLDRVFTGSLLSSATYGSGILSGVSAGQNLALYWFPGVTSIGATLTALQEEAGFFRQTANSVASNSDMGFVLPNDGFGGNLFAYGSDLTGAGVGSIAPSSLNAFSLVPEPSRMVLFGFGIIGLIVRRRR
jgi:hypothetical protein